MSEYIRMRAKEFVRRLLGGERDFRGIIIYGNPNLDDLENYYILINYLRSQEEKLGKYPVMLDNSRLLKLRAPDLYLPHVQATKADFTGAILNRANLSYAHLNGAKLVGVYLGLADLSEGHLNRANLMDANLNEADLRWTHLNRANLMDATLDVANLTGASLNGANLKERND